ncbi:hypothetical protein L2E82_14685 [Cichorium intybus]|uniref:Uncharacterized protein n=1 Tax=Cichorium intybus TaxID=13427 RepID=A0ACB9F0P9_CICIN|nr:hypothetical protein L2E82_14685 [Cichorium intybus]
MKFLICWSHRVFQANKPELLPEVVVVLIGDGGGVDRRKGKGVGWLRSEGRNRNRSVTAVGVSDHFVSLLALSVFETSFDLSPVGVGVFHEWMRKSMIKIVKNIK